MITDFHSHILPGIDDGSRNVEMSVAMLCAEAEQGIHRVIATPHFYPRHETPDHFLEKRNRAEEILRNEMAKHSDLPEIQVGAEIYFFPGISESEALSRLTIGEKRCILLEMPLPPWSQAVYQEIRGIYEKQGLTPIIAHVDRYIRPFKTYDIPERLEELPVLVQANASFFQRISTRPMALNMLKRDQIHLLGSDCHNLDSRAPNLGITVEIIRKKCADMCLQRIYSYQDEVLNDNK